MGKSETSATPQAGLGVYPRTIEAIPSAAVASQQRPFLKKILSGLRLFAINIVVFAVLAEFASLIYINVTKWPGSKPSYHLGYNEFWTDNNPAFGMWHRPNGHFIHKSGCYSVEYDTNSYGARDVERSVHSSAPRTIVLGDSMIEGVGQPADKRLTNILEKDTGREYLNFGSGSFGPLQYALLYKTMAVKFDHNFVLVGVVPDNDFHDMDYAFGKAHGQHEYRPYYADNLSVFYSGHFVPNHGEGLGDHVEAILRAYLASYHIGQYIYSQLYWSRVSPYSGYHDYTSVDIARLEKSLEYIKSTADAHGAKVAVLLIPHAIDFQRVHKTGTNPLGPLVEKWGAENGVAVKDLLPEMDAASGGDFLAYSLCDGHWSERGNNAVAQILEPWIQQIYASKLAQTADAKPPAKAEAKSTTTN
jgi:hypothetical protein